MNPRCRCSGVTCWRSRLVSHLLPKFNPLRIMIMSNLFAMSLVAVTLSFVMTDSAQAGGCNRCGMRPGCAAPSCGATASSVPMATPAPAAAGHMDHAVATPPASAQGNSGTYRSFSYEPTVPLTGGVFNGSAPVYRSRSANRSSHSQTPSYLLPKTDPRRYNGF